MSSLWTPGGEIPVDRNAPSTPPTDPAETPPGPAAESTPGPASEEPIDPQLEEMRRQLLAAPASEVLTQHLMAFYELAAIHLGADRPKLADAKLAIDAIEALLGGLAGRLGPAEEAISAALPQLKMAFVDAKDRLADDDSAAD